MGIFSSILFGSKKQDPEKMQRAAQGRSVVGGILGTSPYMNEWRRQKRQLLDEFEKKERSLRKKWRYEDEDISRALEKVEGRYERKMGEEKGAKYYEGYEQVQRRQIQRERDRELLDLELEKNEAIRNIQKNIKQWKE